MPPSDSDGNIRSLCARLPARPEPVDAADGSCQSRSLPGAGRHADSGTTTAAHAGPLTNRSTTRRTASATSRTRYAENRCSSWSAPSISSSCSASGPALTAARPTRSSWSSTISGTRTSTSPQVSATVTGSRYSMRSPHATWFVQTVIVGEPLFGQDSHARW
jgi:hypothetical protein